jgi:hypothetical protein
VTPELGVGKAKTFHENGCMTTEVRQHSATDNRVDYEPAAAGARLRGWAVAAAVSIAIWVAIFWAVSELF